MGILGNTVDAVVDTTTDLYHTINPWSDGQSTDENIGDTVSNVEDSINDGVSSVTNSVEYNLDTGSETVFSLTEGGFDALAGLFHWLAGFGETIAGVGHWIQNNGGLIPIAGDGIKLIGAFLGGIGNIIAGIFNGFAGGIEFVEGFFAFVQTLNGWEGTGFLLGTFMIIVSSYLIVSAILTGEFLIFTSFVEDAADSFLGAWMGMSLMIWASANLVGALVMAGTGVILISYAINFDRGGLLVFGIPACLLGFPMIFTHFRIGFLGTFLLTAAGFFALVYGTEYVERTLVPRVSSDKTLIGGDR